MTAVEMPQIRCKREQNWACIADRSFEWWLDLYTVTRGCRYAVANIACDEVHFRRCLAGRHAGLQATNHLQAMNDMVLGERGADCQGSPQIRFTPRPVK